MIFKNKKTYITCVKSVNQGYQVNVLIFPSQDDFNCLYHIDQTFCELLENMDEIEKIADPLDYLNKEMLYDEGIRMLFGFKSKNYLDVARKVELIETYPDAREELEVLFENATTCLMFEDIEDSDYQKLYKLARKFFKLIKIVKD